MIVIEVFELGATPHYKSTAPTRAVSDAGRPNMPRRHPGGRQPKPFTQAAFNATVCALQYYTGPPWFGIAESRC